MADKRGGRPGNINAMKNGSKMSRRRLTVGELPKELLAVRREARQYRRDLESAVLAAKGSISALDAHHVDSAAACTIAAGICRHLLRKKLKEMSTGDILACTREMTKAKAARDKAVEALGLDRDRELDAINLLYGPAELPEHEEEGDGPS